MRPIMMSCGRPEGEIPPHELGVGGGGVLCSGSLGTFKLMFTSLLSSFHPPSFPFLPSHFSFFCLHSFSALDMKTSRSNSLSFCLTGSDSKELSFTGWEMEELEERGWDSWRGKHGDVGGDPVWGDWGGSGDKGDEGNSEGRELQEDITGRSGFSRSSSYSADACCTNSAQWKTGVGRSVGERGRGGEKMKQEGDCGSKDGLRLGEWRRDWVLSTQREISWNKSPVTSTSPSSSVICSRTSTLQPTGSAGTGRRFVFCFQWDRSRMSLGSE